MSQALWNDFEALTCLNSSSPNGLKCQSTVVRADTSSLRLQEMQPSRNPSPTTASVIDSTSAQPPWHWNTVPGKSKDVKKEILRMKPTFYNISWRKWCKIFISCKIQFNFMYIALRETVRMIWLSLMKYLVKLVLRSLM